MPPKYSIAYYKGLGYLLKNNWTHKSRFYTYYGNVERAMELEWI